MIMCMIRRMSMMSMVRLCVFDVCSGWGEPHHDCLFHVQSICCQIARTMRMMRMMRTRR